MKELSPQARRLILEAREEDGPSAGRRARVKQRLAVSMAAGVASAGASQLARAAVMASHAPANAAAALLPATGKAGLSLAAVALYVAGGAALGAVALVPWAMTEPVALQSRQRVPAVRASLPATHRTLVPVGSASSTEGSRGRNESERIQATPAVPSSSAPPREKNTSRLAVTSVPSATPQLLGLGAETRLIEAAQQELGAGQGQRALDLLDRHRDEFPSGALAEERDFARVIALCQLGRQNEANAVAVSFLRAAPSSPLVPRLRKSCAFGGVK